MDKIDEILKAIGPQLLRTQPDNKPVVVIPCGISCSGKSTLSRAIVAKYPNYERLSIDAMIAAKHGRYGVDYPAEKDIYFEGEATEECEEKLIKLLQEGKKDIVLDKYLCTGGGPRRTQGTH
ncbi:hypothetical protein F5Y06DRAFT_189752 [Hypoxylon sp. FL0890]|nr:hypothetical protein F5Y06DRAFT_189752 [Hypoxylon sp. FL0890]